jgi:hypothetical protein
MDRQSLDRHQAAQPKAGVSATKATSPWKTVFFKIAKPWEEMEGVGQEIKTKEGQPVDLLAEGQFITEEAV